jgi:hypothetical protein
MLYLQATVRKIIRLRKPVRGAGLEMRKYFPRRHAGTNQVRYPERSIMATRYEPKGVQAEFEPDSQGRVLRNLLGIIRARDMALAESQALALAQRQTVDIYAEDHRFSAQDICDLHRLWLAGIYGWAGETCRCINGAAGGIAASGLFSAAGSRQTSLLCRHTDGNEQQLSAAKGDV